MASKHVCPAVVNAIKAKALKASLADGGGRWVTTDEGSKLFIAGNGDVRVGGPKGKVIVSSTLSKAKAKEPIKPEARTVAKATELKASTQLKAVKLSGKELKAVQDYQLLSYEMNGYMREGIGNAPEKVQRQVIELKKTFAKHAVTLKEDLVVYRGTNIDYLPKDGQQDKAYVSTSPDPNVAAFHSDGGTIMKITVKAGTKVLPILNDQEQEVLLPPFQTFKQMGKPTKYKDGKGRNHDLYEYNS